MKDIAIYGFGGFGKEVACILREINKVSLTWNFIGFFDDGVPEGAENRYGKVLGNMDTLNNYQKPLSLVFAIANPYAVSTLHHNISNSALDYPNIIAPTVTFYDRESLIIGIGNVIVFGSRLSCEITIGSFNLLNSSTYIGHDVKIGDFNVFQPETRISGGAEIGNKNLFGARSTVLQFVNIGNETRIGTGSILIKKRTEDGALYFGNPAKKMVDF